MQFPANTVRIITTGEQESRPVYEYVDNKRTDTVRRDDKGREMHRILTLPAVWNGESIEVSVVMPQPFSVSPFSILAVTEGHVEITARAEGNFASNKFTVYASELKSIGSYADKLQLK